jgi:hypothetical protein
MDCVVAPVDQIFPEGLSDVNVALSPIHIPTLPFGVTVGVAGVGFTVTTMGADVEVQPKMFARITV